MTQPETAADPPTEATRRPRILLLFGPTSYRTGAFLAAAERLAIDVDRGYDLPRPLADYWGVPLSLPFADPDAAVAAVLAHAESHPIDAIVAVDDGATLIAARASAALGLPHNDPAAALAARDKFVMRERLAAAGVPVPTYRLWPLSTDPLAAAFATAFPCVVKPRHLSGSRGVIRADNPEQFVDAWQRTRRLLLAEGADPLDGTLLVERYLPGVEVALEGLLTNGALRTLALFDKPDPLEGPFFEETIYTTPSRLPGGMQHAITTRAAEAATALGLRHGPVHAEFRINDAGVWPIELAGRSIGGLCASVLEFGAGIGLEELILRHAVGLPLPAPPRVGEAAGVMMIPIPRAGLLRAVDGQDDARSVPGITGLQISAPLNHPLVPLPEGASYLGFIFARTASPEAAERALREAHARLRIRIAPILSLIPIETSGPARGAALHV